MVDSDAYEETWKCPKCGKIIKQPSTLQVAVFHLCKRNKDKPTYLRRVRGVPEK